MSLLVIAANIVAWYYTLLGTSDTLWPHCIWKVVQINFCLKSSNFEYPTLYDICGNCLYTYFFFLLSYFHFYFCCNENRDSSWDLLMLLSIGHLLASSLPGWTLSQVFEGEKKGLLTMHLFSSAMCSVWRNWEVSCTNYGVQKCLLEGDTS